MQQPNLLCQKQATIRCNSATGKHAGFFLLFYTLITESCFVPVATAQLSPSISQTVATEKHESFGYAIAAIEHDKAFPAHFVPIRVNCLKK